jgi:putative transposase
MPRSARSTPGGLVYHVLNRGVARLALFEKPGDYDAFEAIMAEAHQKHPIRLLAYCLMPNHWHMVLWPRGDNDLTAFVRWLTHTHVMRWHAHHGTAGTGHLYQGRFKCFPVETDAHFFTLCRYVERNALRAGLTRRAELWQWCSLWRRESGDAPARSLLYPWPLDPPKDWLAAVNRAESAAELQELREAVQRSRPFGTPAWQARTAGRLGLESALHPRGRPKQPRRRS